VFISAAAGKRLKTVASYRCITRCSGDVRPLTRWRGHWKRADFVGNALVFYSTISCGEVHLGATYSPIFRKFRWGGDTPQTPPNQNSEIQNSGGKRERTSGRTEIHNC
jgi:hypothetical protein